MAVYDTLVRMGGLASFGELNAVHSRREIRAALVGEEILRTGHGRYALAAIAGHAVVAHRHTAVLSDLSAAQAWSWKVKFPPALPQLIVPPGRVVRDPRVARFRHSPTSPWERANGLTSPLRTVIDCARILPFDEALAVADSAVRSGSVEVATFQRAAVRTRGPGCGQVRLVAQHVDGRADNPFESCLRAIGIGIPGLRLQPQLRIESAGFLAVVDLADPSVGLVLEADSYEHHGDPSGFVRDRRRYAGLTALGWHVLPFVWTDVMHRPEWVRATVETWLAAQARRQEALRARGLSQR